MQEAFGMLDAIAVNQHAYHPDAERVHQHSERGSREQQHRLVPHRPTIEDREEIGKAEDRKEIAQPRTGLGDLKLVDTQVDHVTLKIDRHSHQRHEPDADLRRDRLQHDGQLEIYKLRQRQHEDQMHHPQLVQLATLPAKDRENHATHPDYEGIGHDIGNARQVTGNRQQEPDGQDEKARAAIPNHRFWWRQATHLAQEKIKGDQRDQRAVAVFRSGPGLRQRHKTYPEDRDRPGQEQREPHNARRVKRAGKNPRTSLIRHRHGVTLHLSISPYPREGPAFPEFLSENPKQGDSKRAPSPKNERPEQSVFQSHTVPRITGAVRNFAQASERYGSTWPSQHCPRRAYDIHNPKKAANPR